VSVLDVLGKFTTKNAKVERWDFPRPTTDVVITFDSSEIEKRIIRVTFDRFFSIITEVRTLSTYV